MEALSQWLSWSEESVLREDFLSAQFAVLSKDGVPVLAAKPPRVDKSKDKDKKKGKAKKDDKKEIKVTPSLVWSHRQPAKKFPHDVAVYDTVSEFAAYAQVRSGFSADRRCAVRSWTCGPRRFLTCTRERILFLHSFISPNFVLFHCGVLMLLSLRSPTAAAGWRPKRSRRTKLRPASPWRRCRRYGSRPRGRG